MDSEDRLAYIRETKKKLGLNLDNVLKKSSRRVVIDGKMQKDMPYLEFNQLFPKIHCQSIF